MDVVEALVLLVDPTCEQALAHLHAMTEQVPESDNYDAAVLRELMAKLRKHYTN